MAQNGTEIKKFALFEDPKGGSNAIAVPRFRHVSRSVVLLLPENLAEGRSPGQRQYAPGNTRRSRAGRPLHNRYSGESPNPEELGVSTDTGRIELAICLDPWLRKGLCRRNVRLWRAGTSNREKGRFSLVRQLNSFCRSQSTVALASSAA